MESPFARGDTGRVRRGRSRFDLQAGPVKANLKATELDVGKRRSGVREEGEDEDAAGHILKSPRIQESLQKPCASPSAVNKRRRTAEKESLHRSPRKSPRLQEIRDLNQQRIARAGKWTPRKTKAPHYVVQKQPQAERGTLRHSGECQGK